MTEKEEIREKARKIRAGLPESRRREAAETVCRTLCHSDLYRNASAVLLYAALPEELSLSALAAACRADGKATLFPRCTAKGEMTFFYAGETDLMRGHYGIYEPGEHCRPCPNPPEDALCVVPALCFDGEGHRLGYGGGYYDRYLEKHPMKTVGVCFREVLMPRLPAEKTDIPVSLVVTG